MTACRRRGSWTAAWILFLRSFTQGVTQTQSCIGARDVSWNQGSASLVMLFCCRTSFLGSGKGVKTNVKRYLSYTQMKFKAVVVAVWKWFLLS